MVHGCLDLRLNRSRHLWRSARYAAALGATLLVAGCAAKAPAPPGTRDGQTRSDGGNPPIEAGPLPTPQEDASRPERPLDTSGGPTDGMVADVSMTMDAAVDAKMIGELVDTATPDRGSHGAVLVYSRTTAVRHLSIPRAVMTLQEALRLRGFAVEASEDPMWFVPARLRQLAVVILVSTTGHPLGEPGAAALAALDEFVRAGGALVGFHAASSTDYDPGLPYTNLIGGKFSDHPGGVRTAKCHADGSHPAVALLPEPFVTEDEIYRMTNLRPDNRVILTCEALSGTSRLPIAWYRNEGAGRVFYTALGHGENDWLPDSSYFKNHALPGILWALGR